MIAYLIHFFPLYSSTFITDEIEELRRQGAKLSLFAVLRPKPTDYPSDFARFYNETVYVFPIGFWLFLGRHLTALIQKPAAYLKCLGWILTNRQLGWKPRIRTLYHFAEAIHLYPEIKERGCRYMHVHFMVGTGTIAVFLNWIYGLPYSMTAHGGDIFEDRLLQTEKLTYARFTRLGTHFNAQFLGSLIPTSEHKSLRVIPFGIDRDKIPKDPILPIASLHEGTKTPKVWRLLTVGRLVWEKAQHLLLDACARLVAQGIPFHLRIVGEGPLRMDLEAQIIALGLEDKVTLLGALPPDQVWKEYLVADLFVLSSISEGSPFVIMEAMACGLPAVAPAMRGIPEMIRDGIDGRLFPTGSAPGMAEAIAGILTVPEQRTRMAEAAKSYALEHYDQVKSITQFHKMLRSYAEMA